MLLTEAYLLLHDKLTLEQGLSNSHRRRAEEGVQNRRPQVPPWYAQTNLPEKKSDEKSEMQD